MLQKDYVRYVVAEHPYECEHSSNHLNSTVDNAHDLLHDTYLGKGHVSHNDGGRDRSLKQSCYCANYCEGVLHLIFVKNRGKNEVQHGVVFFELGWLGEVRDK
jgi:hypothetical protein